MLHLWPQGRLLLVKLLLDNRSQHARCSAKSITRCAACSVCKRLKGMNVPALIPTCCLLGIVDGEGHTEKEECRVITVQCNQCFQSLGEGHQQVTTGHVIEVKTAQAKAGGLFIT